MAWEEWIKKRSKDLETEARINDSSTRAVTSKIIDDLNPTFTQLKTGKLPKIELPKVELPEETKNNVLVSSNKRQGMPSIEEDTSHLPDNELQNWKDYSKASRDRYVSNISDREIELAKKMVEFPKVKGSFMDKIKKLENDEVVKGNEASQDKYKKLIHAGLIEDTAAGLTKAAQMIHKPFAMATEKILGKDNYNADEDIIQKTLNKSVKDLRAKADTLDPTDENTPMVEKLMNQAARTLPNIYASGLGGAEIRALEKVKDFGKFDEAIGMLPFLTGVFGQGSSEAEEKGGDYLTQLKKGLISAGVEGASETVGMPNWFKKMIGGGLDEVEAKTIKEALKEFGKDVFKEGTQEALSDPVNNLADKYLFENEKDKKMFGQGGVFDPKQMGEDFLGGAAIGGLGGVPSTIGDIQNIRAKEQLKAMGIDPEKIEQAKSSQDVTPDDMANIQNMLERNMDNPSIENGQPNDNVPKVNAEIVNPEEPMAEINGLGSVKIIETNPEGVVIQGINGQTFPIRNEIFNNVANLIAPQQAQPQLEAPQVQTASKLNTEGVNVLPSNDNVIELPPPKNDIVEAPKMEKEEAESNIKSVKLNAINVDPERFQFKGNTDSEGVTNQFKNGEEFRKEMAGIITLWRDKNNKLWVVNGHHRVEFAKRSGIDSLNAQILDEKDGWEEKDVRTLGAKINIADGKGTAIDSAKIFKENNMSVEDLKKEGMSLTESKVKTGFYLSKLETYVFSKVVNGELSESKGAIIGENFPNDTVHQNAVFNMLNEYAKKGKNITDNVFKEIIDMVKASDTVKTEQFTLFGTEEIAKSNMVERGEIITGVKLLLNKEKKLFDTLSNDKKAEIIKKAGNVLVDDKNLENKNLSDLAAKILEGFKNSKGTPISDTISKFTKAYSEGTMSKHEATVKAYLEIKKLIKEGNYLGKDNDGNSKASTSVSASGQLPEGKGQGRKEKIEATRSEKVEAEQQAGATKSSQKINKEDEKPVKSKNKNSQNVNKEGKKYEKEKSKEELKQQTEEALSDIKKLEKGNNISSEGRKNIYTRGIKGLAISPQLINNGRVNFIGQVVDSPEKLATISQVYRDPRFETFRIFYMKGDVVVGHEGISSKVPNSVVLHTGSRENFYVGIEKRMESFGADGYYLLHNHPSGNPEPSKEDFNTTNTFINQVKGFKGHVVIDSNKYAHIKAHEFLNNSIQHEIKDLDLGEDKLLKPSIEHPILNSLVNSPEAFAELTKQMELANNMHTIVYVTAKLNVRAIQEVPDIVFKKYDFAVKYLRNRMREFGSLHVFIVSGEETENISNLKRLIHEEIALDVQRKDSDRSYRALGTNPSFDNDPLSWNGEKIRPFKVMEEKSIYNMKVFESEYWKGEMHPWGLEVRTKERTGRDNIPKRSYSFTLDKFDTNKPTKEILDSWKRKIFKEDNLKYPAVTDLYNILDHFAENKDKYFKEDTVKEEQSPYSVELEKKAIEYFGTTSNFKEAGYLTTSGKLLDLSGKKQGASGGYRTQDHREIFDIMEDSESGSEAMGKFMDLGNIRLMPESDGFELTQKPTDKQLSILKRYIDRANGEVIVDFGTVGKHNTSPESKEYSEGTRAEKIFNDIKSFYDNGKINTSMRELIKENAEQYGQPNLAPTFYSQLEKVVEAKVGGKITPEELKKNIDSWALKGLIKQEEVKWSGIKEWLQDKEGKLSKDEIIKQLQASRVKMEEVTKDNKSVRARYEAEEKLNKATMDMNREKTRLSNIVYKVVLAEEKINDEGEKFEKLLNDYTRDTVSGREMTSERFEKLEYFSKKYNLDYTELIKLVHRTKKAYNEHREFKLNQKNDSTKYGSYKVKGGENYTELLFTMPDNEYRSSHWDEHGTIAHTRFTDRIDHEGKKVLFLEEIQSDLHQAGRKRGYKANEEEIRKAERQRDNYYAYLMDKYGDDTIMNDEYDDLTEEENNKREELELAVYNLQKRQYGVPEAPFSKTWHEFILKRMIRYAAENGYDKISWATGEQNADHYDLRKFVSNVKYFNNLDGTYDLAVNSTDGDVLIDKEKISLDEIEGLLGKDVAKKIEAGEGNKNSLWTVLQGDGLAFGGEGMQGFYNKMVPDFLNKYLKKWGAKVEETILGEEINNGKSFEENKEIALKHPEMSHTVQQAVTINAKMRNDVLYDGQALFEESKEYGASENVDPIENEIRTIEQSIEKGNVPPELVLSVTQRLRELKEQQKAGVGTKQRKHAETYQNSEAMHPEVKLELAKKDTTYIPISNKETWENALEEVYKHYDRAYNRIKSTDSLRNAEDTAIAEAILYKLQQEKRYTEASEWAAEVVEKSTNTAQALQALSIWGRLSPEGILRTAQRELNKAATEHQRKTVNDRSKGAAGELNGINDEVLDEVGKRAEEFAKKKNIKGRKSNVKTTNDEDTEQTSFLDDEENIEDIAGRNNNDSNYKGYENEGKKNKLSPDERLAKKVSSHVEKQKGEVTENPIEDMIKTLYKIAKDNLPEKETSKRNPMEIITLAIKNKEQYKEVWNNAQELVKDKFKDNPDALLELQRYFGQYLEKPFHEKDLEKAIKVSLKDLGVDLTELVKQHYSKVNAVGKSLEEKLMDKGLDKAEAEKLSKYIKEQFEKMTSKKKEQILKKMFGTPKTKKQKQLFEKIIEWSNLGAINSSQFKSYVADKLGIPSMNDELAKDLIDRANFIQTMEEGEAKTVEIALMLDRIAREIPPSLWEKVSTTQAIFQLLNPKTYIRNKIGNSLFATIDRYMTYPFAKVGDLIYRAANRSGESTIAMPNLFEFRKGYKEGKTTGKRNAKLGIDVNTISSSRVDLPKVTFRKETAKGIEKILQMHRLETALRVSLTATDEAYKQATIRESLYQQMKLAGVDKPTDDMIDRAKKLAEYRTFQNNSMLASLFSGLKQLLNNPTYTVTRGREGKKRAFGMGDVLIKYPKVPANLLNVAIDYSPLGVAKLMWKAYDQAKSGGLGQFNFAMGMGRASAGTIMIALGYALAQLGLLSGRGDDDDDLRNLQEDTGFGQYRFNITGFMRYVETGKKSSAQARKGDTTINYDWLLPNGLSLAIGSDLAKSGKILGQDTAFSIVEALSSGANTIAEQPLMQGIKRFAQSRDVVTGFTESVKGVPASFVPSILNQVKQLGDNTSRNTYGESYGQEMMNLVKSRTPLASESLLPRVDNFGHNKKTYQNNSNNPLNVFLNPAFVKKFKPTPEQQLVLDIYKDSGNKIQVPRTAEKTITWQGEKYKLTPKEYVSFQRYIGQRAEEELSKINGLALDTDKQAQKIKTILDKISEEGKKEFLLNRGINPNAKKKK